VVCLYTASRPAREVIESIPGTVASAAATPISTSHKTDGSKTPITPKGTNHSVGTSSKSTQSTHSSSSSHSDEDSGRFSPQQVASHERCPVHRGTGWANAIYGLGGGTYAYLNRKIIVFPVLCKRWGGVQAAVGKKPALIGNGKLEVSYVRGKGYLEVDINIGSNTVATHILSMVSLPVYTVRVRRQFLLYLQRLQYSTEFVLHVGRKLWALKWVIYVLLHRCAAWRAAWLWTWEWE
jgi:hypothetical protein